MATLAGNMPNPHFNVDSISMDSSDIESPIIDNNSSCSEESVLSVGNENPVAEPLTFKNIENHLNALSKLSSASLDGDISKSPLNYRLSSPTSSFFYKQSENNESSNEYRKFVSNPNSPGSVSSSPKPDNLFIHHHQNGGGTKTNNNNEDTNGGGGLKFSIDNILKADFGRRITDPLIRKSKPAKKVTDNVKEKVAAPVDLTKNEENEKTKEGSSSQPMMWPAWVYCTRYSDRPSSGRSPRTRRVKKSPTAKTTASDEKRPRTAFSGAQLARLKHEFAENRYLTERRRQQLSSELGLNEAQIKIWFQNKRAKIKKASGQKNPLALQLMAQGLYNHSTIPLTKEEEELQEMQNAKAMSS